MFKTTSLDSFVSLNCTQGLIFFTTSILENDQLIKISQNAEKCCLVQFLAGFGLKFFFFEYFWAISKNLFSRFIHFFPTNDSTSFLTFLLFFVITLNLFLN